MDVKPFICEMPGCTRRYGLRADLNKHIRSFHKKEKPYICDEEGCGKRFGLVQYLKLHKRQVHLKEKRFLCEKPGCGKEFFQKGSLDVHTRIVHNKERYQCTHCGKKFYKRSLDNHIRKGLCEERLGSNKDGQWEWLAGLESLLAKDWWRKLMVKNILARFLVKNIPSSLNIYFSHIVSLLSVLGERSNKLYLCCKGDSQLIKMEI